MAYRASRVWLAGQERAEITLVSGAEARLLSNSMKMRFSLFLSLVIAATALHAADNKDDLPPGLRKKDKLPPGIAKKRGAGEATTITTNVIGTNVTVTT